MPNIKKGPAGRASKRNPEKSGTKKRLGGGLVDKIGQKLHIKKATPERSTWENLCFIDKGSAESHPPGSPLNFQKEPKSSTKKEHKAPTCSSRRGPFRPPAPTGRRRYCKLCEDGAGSPVLWIGVCRVGILCQAVDSTKRFFFDRGRC